MSEALRSAVLTSVLAGPHRGDIVAHHERLGDATVSVAASGLVPLMRWLRDAEGLDFDMLSDLCAVDHLGETPRFEVVYHLYSLARNHRLRVKVRVTEDAPEVHSLVELWPAADWLEREVWDLYGISFRGHPNLKRLLLYEEFEGHPLRKDYPKQRRQPLIGPRD